MKRIVYTVAVLLLTVSGFAQTDTTNINQFDTTGVNEPDTIIVGNFIIIKRNKGRSTSVDTSDQSDRKYSININIGNENRRRNRSTFSTNWFIFDLGFANVRDNTVYSSHEAITYLNARGGPPFTSSDLDLNNAKSSNVNIWLFIQKLNLARNVINLKYGVGIEMYNYRYSTNISYNKNPPYIFRDTVDFSKNKLAADYVTIPFMININPFPNRRRGFSFSAGVSAGYLYNSRNKQISDERGKQKTKGDFDLDPWRLAYIGELGIGPVRVYGSYSFNTLHERGLKQYPYAIGVRFSNL